MITGSRFATTGAEFVPLHGASDFDDRDLNAAFPGRAEATGLAKVTFDVSHLFARSMRSQWETLSAELQDRPADVVVFENTFMGAAPLLAFQVHVPPCSGAASFR